MPGKRTRILIGLAVLCFCAVYELNDAQPFFYSRLCYLYRDALSRSGRYAPANPNLVFLAIDADSVSLDATTDAQQMYGLTDPTSIEARAFGLMTQRFPWPREIYGLILERLVNAGAKVVLFDLTFPTTTDGDPAFRQALDTYREHVVIGSNFVDPSWNGAVKMGAAHTRPPESLIPSGPGMDDRVGFTNFWPDTDDVVRRAQYQVTFEQIEGNNPSPTAEKFISLAAHACQKMGRPAAIPPDLNAHTLRFTGPPRQTFPPHSVFEIFVPDYWEHNYRKGEFFAGKTVVIGAEGNWQHDEHQTPFGSMPGPELHLNAINAALHHEFIEEMPPTTMTVLSGLTCLFALILSVVTRSPLIRLVAVGAADLLYGCIALYVFDKFSLYVPLIGPMAQLNLTVLLGLVTDFTMERVEKNRFRRALERYVSRDLVGQMINHPEAYTQSLGGVVKPVTILFSDIRGYSAVAARSEPHLLVAQLNQYLTAMVECVFRFDGTLDKFIGDAVMAVWGNIRTQGAEADTLNAVRAAQAMGRELDRLNIEWKKRGWPELRAGIAVHHGNVVVGNVGSPQRMEFAVIGDTVNTTWRLQELTKQVGYSFLMSKQVEALVRNHFKTREVGIFESELLQSIGVFTIADADTADGTLSKTQPSHLTPINHPFAVGAHEFRPAPSALREVANQTASPTNEPN